MAAHRYNNRGNSVRRPSGSRSFPTGTSRLESISRCLDFPSSRQPRDYPEWIYNIHCDQEKDVRSKFFAGAPELAARADGRRLPKPVLIAAPSRAIAPLPHLRERVASAASRVRVSTHGAPIQEFATSIAGGSESAALPSPSHCLRNGSLPLPQCGRGAFPPDSETRINRSCARTPRCSERRSACGRSPGLPRPRPSGSRGTSRGGARRTRRRGRCRHGRRTIPR